MGSSLSGAIVVADGGVDLLLNLLKLAELDPEQGAIAPGETRELLWAVERVSRRLEGARLRIIEQGRRVQAPERAGYTGIGPWVAATTTAGGRAGRLQADRAEEMTRTPATRSALDAGTVSGDHAGVIADALRQLPEALTPQQRDVVERKLITLAAELDPGRLRRKARRILEAIEPDPCVIDAYEDGLVESEEDRARAASTFWMRDNNDGTVSGAFTVPFAAGMVLGKVLDAMTAPRRQSGSAYQQRVAAEDMQWKLDRIAWQHRRGLAFAELLEHLPTDRLSNKVAATVLVHVGLDTLTDARPAAAGTDSGDKVSAAQARRWACQAGIIPLVLGTDSVVLDQGGASRLFTEQQRLALSVRYSECAATGCDRPFAWCEIHHLTPWSVGKRTNLDDALPLCGTHHREIDRPGSGHTMHPGPGRTLTVQFHRRT